MNALESLGYSSFEFEAVSGKGQEISHPIYCAGDGPVLLLLQEMPGIGPEMIRLAERFRREGEAQARVYARTSCACTQPGSTRGVST